MVNVDSWALFLPDINIVPGKLISVRQFVPCMRKYFGALWSDAKRLVFGIFTAQIKLSFTDL